MLSGVKVSTRQTDTLNTRQSHEDRQILLKPQPR